MGGTPHNDHIPHYTPTKLSHPWLHLTSFKYIGGVKKKVTNPLKNKGKKKISAQKVFVVGSLYILILKHYNRCYSNKPFIQIQIYGLLQF